MKNIKHFLSILLFFVVCGIVTSACQEEAIEPSLEDTAASLPAVVEDELDQE